MNLDVIANWLQVPVDPWPPDHYTLLGLKKGEEDLDTIEEKAQERLELVRRYQLLHPEPATEAMNRLAQAFVCLTNPKSKAEYDQEVLGITPSKAETPPITEPAPVSTKSFEDDRPVQLTEHQEWFFERLKEQGIETELPTESSTVPPSECEIPEAGLQETQGAASSLMITDQHELSPEEIARRDQEMAEELARSSRRPRKKGKLTTKRTFYYQLAQTRQLLDIWDEAGEFLDSADRKVKGPKEAKRLIAILTKIRLVLRDFPLAIGQAGKPGYLVVALASQSAIVPRFAELNHEQRVALQRDWQTGRKMILAHKKILRGEVNALKSRTWIGKVWRKLKSFFEANPAAWLLLGGALALMIALVREIF